LVDIRSTVIERTLESVSVPAGVFPDSMRAENSVTATTVLSGSGQGRASKVISVDWYASGVGPIKHTLSATGQESTVELLGYYAGGVGRGAVPQGSLVTDLAPANSSADPPGRSAIAYDGTRFLVVVAKSTTASQGELLGLWIAKDGKLESSFSIFQGTMPP